MTTLYEIKCRCDNQNPLKFPSREGNTFVYKGFLTILDLSRYHTRYQILVFRY